MQFKDTKMRLHLGNQTVAACHISINHTPRARSPNGKLLCIRRLGNNWISELLFKLKSVLLWILSRTYRLLLRWDLNLRRRRWRRGNKEYACDSAILCWKCSACDTPCDHCCWPLAHPFPNVPPTHKGSNIRVNPMTLLFVIISWKGLPCVSCIYFRYFAEMNWFNYKIIGFFPDSLWRARPLCHVIFAPRATQWGSCTSTPRHPSAKKAQHISIFKRKLVRIVVKRDVR